MRWNVHDGGRPATRRDWLRAALLTPGGLAVAAGFARGQQAKSQAPGRAPARPQARPAAPVPAPPNPAILNQRLKDWEQRSRTIKTLDARFIRTDINPLWNKKKTYQGRALLQSPNFVFLNLELTVPGKDPEFADRIVCDSKNVYQYAVANRIIQGYPLPKDQKARALEEGPLRFLFNMRADEINERYAIRLIKDEPQFFQLQIVPKLDRDRDAFSQAVVQLNAETFLPELMTLVLTNKKELQQYRFTSVVPNKEINPVNFKVTQPDKWKIVMNPPDGPAANAAQRPKPLFQNAPGVRSRQ